ncbi:DnaJ domain-containing protein [Mycoplasma sp. 744]|uniref:DnaJ C-terminal domain-containing protein n=1 Tax=Mycoplasma sp. 744 TaxID=3108531 RepID=UPI002B1DB3BF|nr:DnaJ C-terminal domain-containing protein [Mycoplasma sp. 744]MEA4115289.1 DnaJ domain-containing protein [Mycoplasma sp. 744]
MSKKDLYQILGVNKNATQQEIKNAYRKLAMQYHPDKLKDGTSDQKMQELNAAYEVLSDPEKRNNYDRFGNADGQANFQNMDFGNFTGGFNFSDIFGDFFSSFGSRQNRKNHGPIRGQDIEVEMTIDFLSAVLGKQIKQTLNKYELCSKCNGTGAQNPNSIQTCNKCSGTGNIHVELNTPFGKTIRVQQCTNCYGTGKIIKEKCTNCYGNIYIEKTKIVTFDIQPGTLTGDQMKLDGFGEKGQNGAPSGNMYISFRVREHKFYKNDRLNIYATVPVSFLDIIKENTILIPSPYGPFEYKLKNNLRDKDRIVIKNKGIKKGSKIGDYIITFNIILPNFSSRDFKKMSNLLIEFNDDSNQNLIKEVEKIK